MFLVFVHLAAKPACEAEVGQFQVDDLCLLVDLDEEVFGLDVPVNYAVTM